MLIPSPVKIGFLLPVLLSMLPTVSRGQIVLAQHSYPEAIWGADSLRVTVHNSLFPSLGTGTDQLWDLAAITDSAAQFWKYRVASPPYQYADSDQSIFSAFPYQANIGANINNGGIFQYSVNVQQNSFSLTTMTLGPIDSFYIPSQVDTYSAPRFVLSFPVAYGSSWSCAYHYDLNFRLTYQTFSFYQVPGFKRSYVTEFDSVTGWGGLRIPDAAGSPTPFLNVLQMQHMTATVDSYFFNGAIMPGIMLTFFSVQQAAKDTVYEYDFYRSGQVTPLAQVFYRDAQYSQPYKATTLVQQLEDVDVPILPDHTAGFSVYPNPVTSGHFSILIPVGSGVYDFSILDCRGSVLMSGPLQSGYNTLYLPPFTHSGLYLVDLFRDGAKKVSLPLLVW